MFWKRMQWVAQIVGLATILGLSALGVLALTGASNPFAMADSPQTLSGVPNVINYQGMLREPDGAPVSGAYTMTFRLYNDPVVGTSLFTDTLSSVMVRDGLFTVLLGDSEGNELDAALFKQPLYVGIQVEDNAEMAPRQRIAPVPYAVQLTDGIYVDGDGDVGVGTTEPSARLHVKQLGGLPTARFEDEYGNGIDIDAYQYGANIDPLEAGDDIYMGRDTTLGQLKIESGTVYIAGDLDIKRQYAVFYAGSSGGAQQRDLGQWDLCALAAYEVAGEDNGSSDWGYCRVWNSWMNNDWGEYAQPSKPPGERDWWYLTANANADVDSVKCQAICFNLGE